MPGFVKFPNRTSVQFKRDKINLEDVDNEQVRGSFGVFTHPIDPTPTHAYMVKNENGDGLSYFPTKIMADNWIRTRKHIAGNLKVDRVDLEDGKFWLKITKTRLPRAKGERMNAKARYEYKSEIIEDYEELLPQTEFAQLEPQQQNMAIRRAILDYNEQNASWGDEMNGGFVDPNTNDRTILEDFRKDMISGNLVKNELGEWDEPEVPVLEIKETAYGDYTKTNLSDLFDGTTPTIPNAFINLTRQELEKVNPSRLKPEGEPLLPNMRYGKQFTDTGDRFDVYYKLGNSEVKIFAGFGDGEDEDKLEQSLIEGELLSKDFFENDGKAFFRNLNASSPKEEYTDQYVEFIHPKLARNPDLIQSHPTGWVYFDGKKETPLGNVDVNELKKLFDDTYIVPQTVENHITIAPSLDDSKNRKQNNWLQVVNEKYRKVPPNKWWRESLISKDNWIENSPGLLAKFSVDQKMNLTRPIDPQLYAWPIPRTIKDAKTQKQGVKVYGFLKQNRSRKIKSPKGDSTYTNHGASIVWNTKEDAGRIAKYNRLNGVPTRVIPINVNGVKKYINLAKSSALKNTYYRRNKR